MQGGGTYMCMRTIRTVDVPAACWSATYKYVPCETKDAPHRWLEGGKEAVANRMGQPLAGESPEDEGCPGILEQCCQRK